MPKLEEAKDLLKQVGLPARQRNDIAAYTLLALAGLSETSPWRSATRRSTTIHNIIGFLAEKYGKRYAENTRETIRRQVIHQFEQARLVDRNPDDPTLSTNSPRTHYALSEAVLPIIKGYGTRAGIRELETFLAAQKSLMEIYARRREELLIPLKDAGGKVYRLSPGKHNRLQVAVVEEFGPRFAPGARLLYLGDASNKMLI